MPVLILLVVLACCFMGAGILCFSLSIIASFWKGAEALLNGLVRGVVLTWRIARGMWRLTMRTHRAAWRTLQRVGTACAHRGHAVWYGWGYVLKRRYIASQLRALRRAARTK